MNKINREPNFTPEESYLLECLVSKYELILKDRRQDGRTLSRRQNVWNQITKEFNAEGLNVIRKVEKLQKRWRNRKAYLNSRPSTPIMSKFKETFYFDDSPMSNENFDTEIKDTETWNAVKGDISNDEENFAVNYSVEENNGFMSIIKELYMATLNAVEEGITNDEECLGIDSSVKKNIGIMIVIKEINMAIQNVVEEGNLFTNDEKALC